MNKQFRACAELGRISNIAHKRSWSELFLHGGSNLNKERKRTKKKELWKGTLVETAAAEEID
jgi:hypothetical protein